VENGINLVLIKYSFFLFIKLLCPGLSNNNLGLKKRIHLGKKSDIKYRIGKDGRSKV
jgi:hypothetical protein